MTIDISKVKGWRRNALAFVFGICGTLALPPFFIFPMLIPAFSGLLLLLHSTVSKQAFKLGWFWGWGFYISGLYWFCIALMTDPDKFAWMIPFALFGITAVIAVYCGLACWLYCLISSPRRGQARRGASLAGSEQVSPPLNPPTNGGGIFIFTAIWTLIEFARGHLFTGFPWNLVGYSFAFSDYSLQLASIFGAYGLTWCAVWLGSVPAYLVIQKKSGLKWVAISYAVFAISLGWGAVRLQLSHWESMDDYVYPVTNLRLVQANISQHHKWDPQTQMRGLEEHIKLMHSPGLENVDAIIWPETAVPYVMEEDSPLTDYLGRAIPKGKLLITGALHKENKGKDYNIWNSMVALDSEGQMVGRYDKHRLVPFGEFIPFRALLPKSLLTPVGDKDFSRGLGPQTVSWGDLPSLSPLICYEAIFPEDAVDEKHRSQLLLNITNDAWFGASSGPYQHFTMARVRAVEQGIPLIRVANTGISAHVDAYGRIVSKLDLGKKAILDVTLPNSPAIKTIYSKYNNLWINCLISISLLLTIWKQKRLTH